jgi:hypothetical protein
MGLINGEVIMNNRFYNFLVVIMVSLFLFSVSPCQSESKNSKPAVESNSTGTLAVPAEPVKSEVNQPAASPASNARIKFDNVKHDLGQIAPDSRNNSKFTFTNVGKDVLKIDNVKGSCKCTVPDLKKKDYAPGESGEISVEFHAPIYQGSTSQRVMVFSNDSENPKIELEIKAYVQSQVNITPEQMTLSLLAPNAGAGEITIASLNGEKFAVTKITSIGDVVSIAFDPNNISDKHVFNPVINMDNLRKYLNGFIVFTLTHPKASSARVMYSCLKEFEASPAEFRNEIYILPATTASL